MKRVLLLCCCIVAFASHAQSGMGVRFGVQGNFTTINLPGPTINGVEPLKDVYGTGLGGGAHLDFNIPLLTFRLSGDYITFAPDNDKFRDNLAQLTGSAASEFSIEGGRIDIFSLALNGKYSFLDALPIVSPYITGGFGLARLEAQETKILFQGQPSNTFAGKSSETEAQFNAGAGVDVNLVGIAIYLEAKYTWVTTEGGTSTYVPITVGVTF